MYAAFVFAYYCSAVPIPHSTHYPTFQFKWEPNGVRVPDLPVNILQGACVLPAAAEDASSNTSSGVGAGALPVLQVLSTIRAVTKETDHLLSCRCLVEEMTSPDPFNFVFISSLKLVGFHFTQWKADPMFLSQGRKQQVIKTHGRQADHLCSDP